MGVCICVWHQNTCIASHVSPVALARQTYVTGGERNIPADRATSLKCDNAGHWSIVRVVVTRPLSRPADELWLNGCHSDGRTYTDNSVFEPGIPAHTMGYDEKTKVRKLPVRFQGHNERQMQISG